MPLLSRFPTALHQGRSRLSSYLKLAELRLSHWDTRHEQKEYRGGPTRGEEKEFVEAFVRGLSKKRDRQRYRNKVKAAKIEKSWKSVKECFPNASMGLVGGLVPGRPQRKVTPAGSGGSVKRKKREGEQNSSSFMQLTQQQEYGKQVSSPTLPQPFHQQHHEDHVLPEERHSSGPSSPRETLPSTVAKGQPEHETGSTPSVLVPASSPLRMITPVFKAASRAIREDDGLQNISTRTPPSAQINANNVNGTEAKKITSRTKGNAKTDAAASPVVPTSKEEKQKKLSPREAENCDKRRRNNNRRKRKDDHQKERERKEQRRQKSPSPPPVIPILPSSEDDFA